MNVRWFPSQTRPLQQPNGVLLAAFITQVLTTLLPSRFLRLALGLPVFAFCAFQLRTHTAGTTPDDYLAAVNLFWLLLRWIDLAIIRVPETSLWRIDRRSTASNEKVNIAPAQSIAQKLKWSLSLCSTYRGIGWNWQVKNIDNIPAGTPRSGFVARQLLKFIRAYIISDFVSYWVSNKAFPDLSVPDVTTLPLATNVAVGWSFATRAVSDMTLLYYLFAALTVSAHILAPEDWPPIFGSWFELYTVRKAWGYCWHQWLRRTLEVYPSIAASSLGLTHGTLTNRYFKLYAAFILSGCIHYAGALNVPWTPGTACHFMFFAHQPFFITFEDVVIHFGKRLGLRKSLFTIFIGYVWVFLTFSFTLPLMTKSFYDWAMLDHGFQTKNPVVVWSVADRILG